jgi:hypothetical protein
MEIDKEKVEAAKKSCVADINLINTISFNKRTLAEWSEYYKVSLPDDMTVKDCYLYFKKITALLSDVNHKYSQAVLAKDLHHSAMKTKKAAKLLEVKKDNPKYTVDQLQASIEVEFEDDNTKEVLHTFLVEFFERIQGQLIGMRKVLESVTYSVNSELKAFGKGSEGFGL